MWFQGSKFVSVKDEEIPISKIAMKRVSYASPESNEISY
jgi:hypothetical protein